ncbi:sulfurtransferase complex subunit TusB [Motiliproteus sediminis]|uniref:sulfurtransferase complex subunit TusB n=1 Tax=Motiliproteus sediminis TaxID=1468178 RepID=UPI001AEF76C8|nr:sulfurtransferase complex subunit TusB [Motiliproteus sediminis]
MILHTVNRAPGSHAALQQCIQALSGPAALLLIEDGVYGATPAFTRLFHRLDGTVHCYVLAADLQARGIDALVDGRFQVIDDAAFVQLSLDCDKMVAWY